MAGKIMMLKSWAQLIDPNKHIFLQDGIDFMYGLKAMLMLSKCNLI